MQHLRPLRSYESLSSAVIKNKKRIHFHAFMEDVHKRKHRLDQAHKKGGQDLIISIARELARESEVLCFDEFQVCLPTCLCIPLSDDSAGAGYCRRNDPQASYRITVRLRGSHNLHFKVSLSCCPSALADPVVSSRHPNDLYKNGIQRAAFIPCIELIKRQFVVEDLDSGTDYRKVPRALSKVYYDPVEEHRPEFNKLFEAATDGEEVKIDRTVSVWGRDVTIAESTSKVARMTFADLCSRPLSASDYMEITRTFDTIFITDVPQLTLNDKDKVSISISQQPESDVALFKARRFILFIDSAYESKVCCSSLRCCCMLNTLLDETLLPVGSTYNRNLLG